MSQCDDIRAHLEAGYSLTALEALQRFQCFRLAARIRDLRDEGMEVESEMVLDEDTGKSYARYSKHHNVFKLEFSP